MATVKFQFDVMLKKTASASPPYTKKQTIELDQKIAMKAIQEVRKIIAESFHKEYPFTNASGIQNLKKI